MALISLPWPAPHLWPNRRPHWAQVHRRQQAQKLEAWALALAAKKPPLGPSDEPIPLKLTFCKPDRGRFDLDNALAAMKGALDGVALAWGVDDSRFRPVPLLGEPVAGGAVEIEVGAAMPIAAE